MAKPITIKIAGDEKDLERALQNAQSRLDDLQNKVKQTGDSGSAFDGLKGKMLGVGAAVGGAFAGAKLIDFGGDLMRLGTEMDTIGKKSATVFEGSIGSVDAWAKANAGAMGMTKTELVGMAAGFGDLIKPMGFSAEKAAEMSTKTVGLAGALSAWSGGKISAKDASEKLAKAMLGERDGLVELGIKISDNDVKARLAQKGQQDLTGAALEQATALATQELIFEKSTDAQTAWANGSMSAVQAQNKSKAAMGEAKEALAGALTPAFQALGAFVAGTLVPVLQNQVIPAFQAVFSVISGAAGFLGEHKELLVALAIGIGVALVPALVAWAVSAGAAAVATLAAAAPVVAAAAVIAALAAGVIYAYQHIDFFRAMVDQAASFLRDVLWPALQSVGSFLVDVFVGQWDLVKGVIQGTWEFFQTLGSIAGGVIDGIKGGFDTVVGFVTGLPGRITSAASGMWDGIKDAFKGAINAIIGMWNGLEFKIPGFKVGPIGYDGFTLGVPNIPYLASGGTALRGGLAVVGERGAELVDLPAGAVVHSATDTSRILGGGETTIVLYNTFNGVMPEDIPDTIVRTLREKLRRFERSIG